MFKNYDLERSMYTGIMATKMNNRNKRIINYCNDEITKCVCVCI